MGRHISPDPLAHVVSLRLTAAQLLTAKELAAAAGAPGIADYLRSLIQSETRRRAKAAGVTVPAQRGSPGRPRKVPQPPPTLIDPATYHELRRLGVNLNQIAHQLNAMQLVPPPVIAALVADIRALLAPAVGGVGSRHSGDAP